MKIKKEKIKDSTYYPSAQTLKKMGFFNDQDGILKRYIAEQEKWNSHLENSKQFIIRHLEKTKPESVAILGSGWLLDVPVEYLINNTTLIRLYDIRHPRQILHKYQNRNFEFHTMDITGGAITGVYNLIKNNSFEINSVKKLEFGGFKPAEQSDCIISLNIMNQLDTLIVEYIRRKTQDSGDVISLLRKKIQEAHIDSLPKNRSLVVTDYLEEVFDRRGKLVSKADLIYTTIPESEDRKEWIWNFDSQMTYYPNRRTQFRVLAQTI